MSGLFGLVGHPQASRLAYFGLYAQQHRGQESAGIATWHDKQILAHADLGLVPDVFTETKLNRLAGDTAIGHVSYAGAAPASKKNSQPLVVRVRGRQIAVAHNGCLTNASILRKQLEKDGAIFQTDCDSELFLHLIARSKSETPLEEAIIAACQQIEGAYSLLVLSEGRLFAIRDPRGMRPLALGIVDGAYTVASETCAFDLLEAELIRSIEPGEMLVIENNTLSSHRLPIEAKPAQCIFELVYFARPDSIVFGEDVYMCRKRMGMALAKEAPQTEADYTVPFPDSGIYSALGFAQQSGIPFEHALIRNHYVGRTFIQPTQNMRQFSVRVKINPVRSMIDGKNLCIVDDSIVRGTTARTRVMKLRELGAKKVHFMVACPPVAHPCHYGVDFADPQDLVAVQHPLKDIPALLGLDSLHFLSEEGLKSSVSQPENYCLACFNGKYPTNISK